MLTSTAGSTSSLSQRPHTLFLPNCARHRWRCLELTHWPSSSWSLVCTYHKPRCYIKSYGRIMRCSLCLTTLSIANQLTADGCASYLPQSMHSGNREIPNIRLIRHASAHIHFSIGEASRCSSATGTDQDSGTGFSHPQNQTSSLCSPFLSAVYRQSSKRVSGSDSALHNIDARVCSSHRQVRPT